MRVHNSDQAELKAVHTGLKSAAAKDDAPKASFAAELAKSSAAKTTSGTSGSNTAPKLGDTEGLPKGPKGETTRQVPNHPYLEIMSGPRNGLFINTTHNERRGEAFALVKRHDRDLHIYGTGKDRRVIISWHKDQPAHRNDKPLAPAQDTGGTTHSTS